MSPEKQRIKIAEACGWSLIERRPALASGAWLCGLNPKPDTIVVVIDPISGERREPNESDYGWEPVPNYLTDLNAIAEAEKVVPDGDRDKLRWALVQVLDGWRTCSWEMSLSDIDDCLRATAAQRAEALLRTLNLWDDTK